jgi:hypothetical protein
LSSVMRAWPRIVLTRRDSRSVRAEAMRYSRVALSQHAGVSKLTA